MSNVSPSRAYNTSDNKRDVPSHSDILNLQWAHPSLCVALFRLHIGLEMSWPFSNLKALISEFESESEGFFVVACVSYSEHTNMDSLQIWPVIIFSQAHTLCWLATFLRCFVNLFISSVSNKDLRSD